MSFFKSIGRWFRGAAAKFFAKAETVATLVVQRVGADAADWLQDIATDAVKRVAKDPSLLTNAAKRDAAAKEIWNAAEARGLGSLLGNTGIVNFVLEQAFVAMVTSAKK